MTIWMATRLKSQAAQNYAVNMQRNGDKLMGKKIRNGEKSMADMIKIEFDTSERKDEFIRRLASAKSEEEVTEIVFGNDRGSTLTN